MAWLKEVVTSPWTTGAVGLGMVLSAAYELLEPWLGSDLPVDASHGVLLMGVVHLAKAGVEGVEGARKVEEAIVAER